MCTYTPSNTTKSSKNISESTLCWESSDMDRFLVYQLSLVIFVTISGNKFHTIFFIEGKLAFDVGVLAGFDQGFFSSNRNYVREVSL